jgi:hypothetical protein
MRPTIPLTARSPAESQSPDADLQPLTPHQQANAVLSALLVAALRSTDDEAVQSWISRLLAVESLSETGPAAGTSMRGL